MKQRNSFANLFQFNMYIFKTKKKKNSKNYGGYEDLFTKSFTGLRIKLFFSSFFYFLHSFWGLTRSTKKVLFHFTDFLTLEENPLPPVNTATWISSLVRKTGSYMSQVWMPGVVTNFHIARWSISRYTFPTIFYTKIGLMVLAFPVIAALRESRNSYTPAIVLNYSFPGSLLSTNDFSYFFASFFYSIWFLARGFNYKKTC